MILAAKIEPQEGETYIRRVAMVLEGLESVTVDDHGVGVFHDDYGFIRYVEIPRGFEPPKPGDVLRISLNEGEVRLLYRKTSPHNTLFFTERCNSRCIMCSQPPRDIRDDHHVDEILKMIPLIDPETVELGISGGEPTLLEERFIKVIESLKSHLPQTSVHVLTNGRWFSREINAERLSSVKHHDIMLGIPLYADVASRHDYIVQAQGAFTETLRGLLNLGKYKVPIELRFVVHKETLPRLRQTARFIARNLPFVHQVAFMWVELTGYARTNVEALWLEPDECGEDLVQGVAELSARGVKTFLYNFPLCLLPSKLRPLAVRSISDWKNVFTAECNHCVAKESCCGFFATFGLRPPRNIKALAVEELIGSSEHSR